MRILLGIVGLCIFVTKAGAEKPGPNAEKQWQEVCEYDRYCKNLKNKSDGSWIAPKQNILEILKISKSEIHRTGQEMGVDPRAIAGAILAENSMNVQVDDDVQDFLVKWKIAKNGNLFGRKFTFGLGQIHPDVAYESETYLAKVEHRKPKSLDDVTEALLTPGGSIYYVAATMRRIQDIYLAQGFDISKSPDILATVYNLGQPEKRAAEAKAAGRAPRKNYFGLFVNFFAPEIDSTIGPKPRSAPVAVATQVPPSAPAVAPKAKPKPIADKPRVSAPKPIYTTRRLTAALPLRGRPPSCSKGEEGLKGEYLIVQSYQSFAVTGNTLRGDEFEEVAPTVDCDLKEWVLIRSSSGARGWVERERLDRSSKKTASAAPPCKFSSDPKCAKELGGAVTSLKAITTEGDQSFFKLAGEGEPNWHKPNVKCGNRVPSVGSNKSVGPSRPLTLEQIAEIESLIQGKIEEAKKLYSIGDWDDTGKNPYASFIHLKWRLQMFEGCKASVDKPAPQVCAGDFNAVKAALVFPLKLEPTYQDVSEAATAYELAAVSNYTDGLPAADPAKLKTKWEKRRPELLKAFARCFELSEHFPQTKLFLAGVRSALESDPDNSQRLMAIDEASEEFPLECERWAETFQIELKSPVPAGMKATENQCLVGMKNLPHSGTSRLTMGMARNLLKSTEDRDDAMMGAIKNLNLSFRMGQPAVAVTTSRNDSSTCTYDPFKTAKQIAELIQKHPCIRTVQVPDPWLYSYFEKNPVKGAKTKVMWKPFLEDDRFSVETSSLKCGGEP